jgi:hypothetical protein
LLVAGRYFVKKYRCLNWVLNIEGFLEVIYKELPVFLYMLITFPQELAYFLDFSGYAPLVTQTLQVQEQNDVNRGRERDGVF